jgi:phosphatidylglycerophosphate synthase
VNKNSDGILSVFIAFAHERLGLSPNQVSVAGFVMGILAAILVAGGYLESGLIALALSQITDGIDGGIARRYGLVSDKGKTLDTVFDRVTELMIFLALALTGFASYRMVALAFVAILLVTAVEPLSKFDPGFKRFMIYFGYLAMVIFHIRGFEIALHVVFWANLIAFIAGTILVDYRLQREIDAQAILRRDSERAFGIVPLPEDPPSLLSRVFS